MTGRELRSGRQPQVAHPERPDHGPAGGPRRPDRSAGDRAPLTVRVDATPEEIVAVVVALQALAAPPTGRPTEPGRAARAARVAALRRPLPVDRSAPAWRRGAR
ncbi:hypothetical protein [Micromonospora matsumotoense]|uniref:hypothetical protein n=1 Tax=Micromonospora matsumotoense TaxID=121616 RepID=UPI00340B7CB9